MFGVFPLTPAYGRDYKSKAEVTAALIAGKDFKTVSGQYCTASDFKGKTIEVRYNKLRAFTTYAVPA